MDAEVPNPVGELVATLDGLRLPRLRRVALDRISASGRIIEQMTLSRVPHEVEKALLDEVLMDGYEPGLPRS